jgi:hypothetical protein
MALKIPTRTERTFVEHRGEYRDIEVEDRPYRVIDRKFIEHKGCHEDIVEYLTDAEILEHGGIKRFFNDDGSRRKGSWPFDPDTAPAPRSKKKAKRKAKKKAAKKKT